MKKIFLIAALLLVAGFGLQKTVSGADNMLEQGRTIFEANCQICHGQNGKGDGPAAAVLNPKPADFTKPGFWTSISAKTIAETIKKGKGQMPPFGMDEANIQAVIYYLMHTFKPADAPKS